MYDIENGLQRQHLPRIALMEQKFDTMAATTDANFNRTKELTSTLTQDVVKINHRLGAIQPQTDENFRSLVLITAKTNLCELRQHHAIQEDLDLRRRMSLAEANFVSFRVLIEQVLAPPIVESSSSSSFSKSEFAPSRVVGTESTQAFTVHDPESPKYKLKDVVATHELPQTTHPFELYSANDYHCTPSVEKSCANFEIDSQTPTNVDSFPIVALTDPEHALHDSSVNSNSSTPEVNELIHNSQTSTNVGISPLFR
jgi:hypothetical protein